MEAKRTTSNFKVHTKQGLATLLVNDTAKKKKRKMKRRRIPVGTGLVNRISAHQKY